MLVFLFRMIQENRIIMCKGRGDKNMNKYRDAMRNKAKVKGVCDDCFYLGMVAVLCPLPDMQDIDDISNFSHVCMTRFEE